MKKILKRIRDIIKKKYCFFKYIFYKKYCKRTNQNEFLMFNAPKHGNIGDHAILSAEKKLLLENNKKIFEILIGEEKYYLDILKKNVSKKSIVLITGGGYLGSQWIPEMNAVNKVIECLKNNKIIIFPQTIYFKDDAFGKRELEKSKNTFNNAINLNIFVREKQSYEFAKTTYKKANVFLVPDIVLLLPVAFNNLKRQDLLLCLRNDVEGIFNEVNKKRIKDIITNKKINIRKTDTVVNYKIKAKNRDKEINKKLKEFASSKIVITDRLHGMIFAVITNTPCIVFSNYNYKVKGVYEWIKEYKFIKYCDDIEQLDKRLDELLNDNIECNYKIEKKDFEKLLDVLEGEK